MKKNLILSVLISLFFVACGSSDTTTTDSTVEGINVPSNVSTVDAKDQ